MRTVEQIVAAYIKRKKDMSTCQAMGAVIKKVYNGDLQVALPELAKNERAAVANLVLQGIDGHAQRIGSVDPALQSPATRTGEAAMQRALDRRGSVEGWLRHNGMRRKRRRRARHLIAYASTPVLVRPGPDGIPRWEVRNPLATYPAPCDPDDLVPPDCIFEFEQTYAWLQANYGDTIGTLSTGPNPDPDLKFTIIQFYDRDTACMIALGQESIVEGRTNSLLYRTENRLGRPIVVVPGRITLDRLQGQFDQIVGMHEAAALLWAMQLDATKRSIYAETYIESPDQTNVDFEPADPYTGEVGKVTGGTIKQFRPDPATMSLNAIDRLQESERATGAIPAEFSGLSASNTRTGRRGGQILSSTIDFPIQEHQEILAASLEEEICIAIETAKAYTPNTTKTFILPGYREAVSYTPSITFEEGAYVFASYTYAGSDSAGMVVEMGQRLGMEVLSHETFMEQDPTIPNVEVEKDRILLEGVQRAHLQSIEAQAQDPNGPWQPGQLSRLYQLVYEDNLPLYKAELKLQQETQEQQANAAQGALPAGQMQPGLAMPGAPGTAQAAAAVPAAGPSMGNLSQLMSQLTNTGQAPGG